MRSRLVAVATLCAVLSVAFVPAAGAAVTAFNFTPLSQAYNGSAVSVQIQVTNSSAGNVTTGNNYIAFNTSPNWTVPTQIATNLQNMSGCILTLSQSSSTVYIGISTTSTCVWGSGTTSFFTITATPNFTGSVAPGAITFYAYGQTAFNVNTFSVLAPVVTTTTTSTTTTTTTVPATTTTLFTTASAVTAASDFSTAGSNIPSAIMSAVPYLIGLLCAVLGVRFVISYVRRRG